jgi:serine phosphatase RsbU (regulator of sigma subunit)
LPGDVLLVGSDGIHTVAGKHGDFFEDERLPRLLSELVGHSGEDIIQRLADETLRFGNGEPLPDDLNLLAITRE